MLHNFRLALNCLLIFCILLAGCTAPRVDEGKAQVTESQKQLENQNLSENIKSSPPVEQAPLQLEEIKSVVHTASANQKKETPMPVANTNPNTGAAPAQAKTAATKILSPAGGKTVYSNSNSAIDASNAAQGYVMVKYSGSNQKVKLQITRSGGSTYTYNLLARDSYEVFPLSAGNGNYTIALFENIGSNQYMPGLSKTISVKLANSMGPFLYPNQFVNFNAKTKVVSTASALAKGAVSDLDFVEKVYDYAMSSLNYDDARAASVGTSSYLPNLDSIIQEGKGICFDYAAVMTAMLRSQGIPTRLEVGVAAGQRHAWISTYITNVGWINNTISFDGKNWRRLDPTFADQGNEAYTANDANYQVLYYY